MATFVREGNGLTASGEMSTEEIEQLIAHGQELLESEAPQVLLDVRKAAQEGSSFIGAIAHLGAEARARSSDGLSPAMIQPFCAPFSRRIRVRRRVSISAMPTIPCRTR